MGFAPAPRRGGDAIAECAANPLALISYAETKSGWFSDTLSRYRISGSVLCTDAYITCANKAPQGLDNSEMSVETYESVFDVLTNTPQESANMTARADLLLALREEIKTWDVPQEQVAARVGLTRPRLNDLMHGKLDKFSLDALVNVASAAGFVITIRLSETA